MLFVSSCNSQRSTQKADCETLLKNKNLTFDLDNDVDKYVKEITNQVSALKQREIKNKYHNCTKPEIIRHYLKMHPQIDSVIITPSGHGISFLRMDKNVWSNIIID